VFQIGLPFIFIVSVFRMHRVLQKNAGKKRKIFKKKEEYFEYILRISTCGSNSMEKKDNLEKSWDVTAKNAKSEKTFGAFSKAGFCYYNNFFIIIYLCLFL
jgi:hypothetical protein